MSEKTQGRTGTKSDPPPFVITLLANLLDPDQGEQEREAWRHIARRIVLHWFVEEDINELREILGVRQDRRRRRTIHTAAREYNLARDCFVRLTRDGLTEAQAKDETAGRFHVDVRTVERALSGWRDELETHDRAGLLAVEMSGDLHNLVESLRREFPELDIAE